MILYCRFSDGTGKSVKVNKNIRFDKIIDLAKKHKVRLIAREFPYVEVVPKVLLH